VAIQAALKAPIETLAVVEVYMPVSESEHRLNPATTDLCWHLLS